MKIAFFGSPAFVVPIVKELRKEESVSLVVTQPDKPVGRKKIVTATPVKQFAVENNIQVFSEDNKESWNHQHLC